MTPTEATVAALLPSWATRLERVIAALQLDRSELLDVDIIRRVVDPATCPAPLLPWLAWSLSVDVWDDGWSDATKRAVIAASPAVHRRKGLRAAVVDALTPLGIETSILEWWQSSPEGRRGTFRVTLHLAGPSPRLPTGLLEAARSAVRRAKPKSRVFDLALSAKFSSGVSVAAAGHARVHVRLPARIATAPPPVADGSMNFSLPGNSGLLALLTD